MHLSKDQFGNIRHLLENRFGSSLQVEETPYYHYDSKTQQEVENGKVYSYLFEHSGQKFKLEVVEKQKMQEHEKVKDGRVVGRHFEAIADAYVYDLKLLRQNKADDWDVVDLDIGDLLG